MPARLRREVLWRPAGSDNANAMTSSPTRGPPGAPEALSTGAGPRPVSRELVEACYHAILRRPPEDAAVVDAKVNGHADVEALLRDFLDSAEFTRRIFAEADIPGRREAIAACYRAILGRPPESQQVVDEKIAGGVDLEEVIRDLLESQEYKDRVSLEIAGRPRRGVGDYLHAPPQPVDVEVSEAQLAALFERLREGWRKLGEEEPFWSVYTHDEYRSANVDSAALERLYASGAEHAGLIELFAARSGIALPRGVCLELGCGVGRVTKHLAAAFERVIAVDISDGNMRQCRAMAEREGLTNIDFVVLGSPEELAALPPFDVLYSMIVLQHNQPPVQHHMLDVLLGKLRPGGVFLFQTQTYYPGYEFDIDAYLAMPSSNMEMHSLPMSRALRLIARHGGRVLEVLQDGWTGRQGSHTFFGAIEGGAVA